MGILNGSEVYGPITSTLVKAWTLWWGWLSFRVFLHGLYFYNNGEKSIGFSSEIW